jgi:hypothetical protein
MSTALEPTVDPAEVLIYDRALSHEEIASRFERLGDLAIEVENDRGTVPDDSDV